MRLESNSASSQCKNKHSSGLQQSLTDQFNLRIIRTYGAAANGKGAIDTMSSFGVKSIVKKDLVTHDVLCNNSCDIAKYLASQNLQYYYHTIPVESVVPAQQKDSSPIELQGCMKQHLIIFRPNEKYFCKEYLCDFTSFLHFDFENCTDEDVYVELEDELEDTNSEEELFDEKIDQTEQIFDFITVPSFVSLYSGKSIEPLFFVQVSRNGVAEENISDPCGHFVAKGERYFEGLHLKLVHSRNVEVKQFSTLPTRIVIAPDESYVDVILILLLLILMMILN